MVVVPKGLLPTVNMELFPERREATVDLPTPRPPTMETIVSCVLKSSVSAKVLNLALASSGNDPK